MPKGIPGGRYSTAATVRESPRWWQQVFPARGVRKTDSQDCVAGARDGIRNQTICLAQLNQHRKSQNQHICDTNWLLLNSDDRVTA